ncbi:hypothetical protein [Maribacter litoralis]|uniref:hypothetical protein n=1 Tax=Maribacter litoralis TaxID=2059726 RepID=UPI003F5CD0C1
MKRPSILIGKFLCAIIISAFISCNEQPKEQDPKKPEKPVVLAPQEIVPISQAKNMYDSYEKRRVPLIQRYEDSINKITENDKEFHVGRFVYYDYKTIKQYLEYIEQEAADAGVEISTLRLYYSNYPDEEFFPKTKDSIKHPRQNSIMLSPTYNDGKRDYLFYIAQGAEGKEAVPMNNSFEPIKVEYGHNNDTNTKAYASFAPTTNPTKAAPAALQGEESLTLNRGTGVPPPKNQ